MTKTKVNPGIGNPATDYQSTYVGRKVSYHGKVGQVIAISQQGKTKVVAIISIRGRQYTIPIDKVHFL